MGSLKERFKQDSKDQEEVGTPWEMLCKLSPPLQLRLPPLLPEPQTW